MEQNRFTEIVADVAGGVIGVGTVSISDTYLERIRGLQVGDDTPQQVLDEIADVLFKRGVL